MRGSDDEQFNGVVLGPSDGIYATGYIQVDANHKDMVTAHLLADGSFDPDFGDGAAGTNGTILTRTGRSAVDGGGATTRTDVAGNAIILQGQRPVVAGYAVDGSGAASLHQRLLLARFVTNATTHVTTLDDSFTDGGVETEAIGTGDASATDLHPDANGQLDVVGTAIAHDAVTQPFAARFMTSGGFDTGFGSSGSKLVVVGDVNTSATGAAFALTPSFRAILAGTSGTSAYLAALDASKTPLTVTAVPTPTSTTPPVTPQAQPGVDHTHIVELLRTVDFDVPPGIVENEPVSFTVVDINSSAIKSVKWDLDMDQNPNTIDLGDLSPPPPSNSPSIEYQFPHDGTYRVSVQVTQRDGQVFKAIHDVTVVRPPRVSLRWSPAYPHPGDSVTFTMDTHGADGTKPTYYLWSVPHFGKVGPARPVAVATYGVTTLGAKPRATQPAAYDPLAVSQAFPAPGTVKVVGKNDRITAKDTFKGVFTKAGRMRVRAGYIAQNGQPVTVDAVVGVSDSWLAPKGSNSGSTVDTQECGDTFGVTCPQIGISGDLITKRPITFSSVQPPLSAKCTQARAGSPETAYQMAHDLVDPAPDTTDIGTIGATAPESAVGARSGGRSATRSPTTGCCSGSSRAAATRRSRSSSRRTSRRTGTLQACSATPSTRRVTTASKPSSTRRCTRSSRPRRPSRSTSRTR
jgi:hypothetical protein